MFLEQEARALRTDTLKVIWQYQFTNYFNIINNITCNVQNTNYHKITKKNMGSLIIIKFLPYTHHHHTHATNQLYVSSRFLLWIYWNYFLAWSFPWTWILRQNTSHLPCLLITRRRGVCIHLLDKWTTRLCSFFLPIKLNLCGRNSCFCDKYLRTALWNWLSTRAPWVI